MSLPPWKRLSLKWGLLVCSSALLGSVYVTRVLNGSDGSSAMPQHVVKTIVMPSRVDLATNNLQPVFRDLEFVHAFEKGNADLEMMESAKLLDRSWDSDGKLRETFSVSYPQAGEVSCTLSHRRVLEGFLASEADTMLVLEDDAVALTENITQEIEEIMKVAPEGWDYINLGRCWDVCDARRKKVVASFNVSNASHLSKKGTLEKSLGWEMCTHAYLVTRTGAEKLLQYTQPILLPYDHTVNVLGRQGLLDVYFTSPRLFTQSDESESMLRTKENNMKPVCDPNGDKRSKALEDEVPIYDRYIMAKINRSPVQSMVSIETMLLQEAETPDAAEQGRDKLLANLCSRGKEEFCVRTTQVQREIAQHCSIHGGGDLAFEADEYPAVIEFLDELDQADLDGVVIWGLRPEEGHSHRYVHSAMHRAVQFALDRSPVPRHLCYVKETPGFDLGTILYRDSSRGKMARSLVFTSPKHMTWSNDMGFLTLPVEETSQYVFHGMTPRPHEVLKKIGRAVEWETWGHDGHIPIFDSQEFIRGDVSKPHEGCHMDEQGKHFECAQERLVVMPWATEFLPTEIMENKKRIEEVPVMNEKQEGMHFVGTIWYCNLEQFIGFTQGCLEENVTVTRHGKFMLSKSIDALKEMPNFEMKDDLDELSIEDVFRQSNSMYAPAFQGSCHLDSSGGQSYIADRLLNVIAMGMYPMTNNPSAIEFLGNTSAIVFSEDETELCHAAVHHDSDPQALPHLMDVVAKEHTYVSRLNSILRFFRGPIKSSNGPMIETRAHLEESDLDIAVDGEAEENYDVEIEQVRKLEAVAAIPEDLGKESFLEDELHEFDMEAEDFDERDLEGIESTMGTMPSLTSSDGDNKKPYKPWRSKTTRSPHSTSPSLSGDDDDKKRQKESNEDDDDKKRQKESNEDNDDQERRRKKNAAKRKKQQEKKKRQQQKEPTPKRQTPRPPKKEPTKKKLTRKQIRKRRKRARIRAGIGKWGEKRRTLVAPSWLE